MDALNAKSFEELFSLSEVQQLQDEFARTACVGCLITRPDGTPLTRPSNYSAGVEDLLQQTQYVRTFFLSESALLDQAGSNAPAISGSAESGFWSASAFITSDNRHIATWLIGPVRDENLPEITRPDSAEKNVDIENVPVKSLAELPVMTNRQFRQISRLHLILAGQLTVLANYKLQQNRLSSQLLRAKKTLQEQRPLLADLLENSDIKLKIFLNASPDMYFFKDKDLRYLFVNSAMIAFFGLAEQDILGKTDDELLGQEAGSASRSSDLQVLRGSGCVVTIGKNSGRIFETHRFPVLIHGKTYGIGGISHDITEKMQAEEMLKQSHDRLELAMTANNDGLWDWNIASGRAYFDPRYYTMAGYQPGEFSHSISEWTQRVHPEDISACNESLQAHFSEQTVMFDLEFRFLCKNGTWMWIRGRGKCVERDQDGNPIRMVGTHTDIDEIKKQQQKIEYLSFHDHLTGLYNRRFLDEELKRLDTERNLPLTLLFFDVNGLKLINDAFGHSAGDRLLKKLSAILKQQCRGDEIIARIGGDEFVILLPRTGSAAAENIVNRINSSIATARIETGNISVALGWSTKSKKTESIKDIFKAAESKMYQHKIYEQTSARSESITFIMKTLYEKIPREQQHSDRVSYLCGRIGTEMGLNHEEIRELVTAAKLHDIGKIAISNELLNKSNPLSAADWLELKRHPEISYSILNAVDDYAPLALIALTHQERFDGTGYPRGLSGKKIPLPARIIAVADAYDAMTCGRPYRQQMSTADALEELETFAGSQFDPDIVRIFAKIIEPESRFSA